MKPVEYRNELYEVFASPGEPVSGKIDRGLEIGMNYLGLSIGFFTKIGGGIQEFVHVKGNHPEIMPGETCPLENAYCRRTIELESPLAVQDAVASPAISDSAIETFDLGAYIGARVIVDDETYGTICFADTDTRDAAFSDAESYFVELLAGLVGQALERQVYEEELAAQTKVVDNQEEVYRAVVDSSFDLVFQIDGDGHFTYFSSAVEELLGYTPDEYVGEPFTSLLPGQETEVLAQKLYEAVMGGQTIEEQYFPLEDHTGDIVLVDLRVTPLYSGDVPPDDRTPADIVGVQGMARDAMGRLRRERLIRVLNRVLRHNLRNDINIISGYAGMLQDRLSGENETYAMKIVETSERLVNLSETARKFEENLDDPVELTAVDIVPVVTRAANQIDKRYPDVSISLKTPGSAVAKSAPRLQTAIEELVDNAAKHTGKDPSIEITVRAERESRVSIRIRDNGPGLPEQERRVLLAGEETPLIHGSGLGLWLVHWIVESLDGQLTVTEGTEKTSIGIILESGEGR